MRARFRTWLVALWALSLLLAAVPGPSAEADRGVTCQRRGRARRVRRPRLTAAQRRAIRRRHARAPRTAIAAWLAHEPPPLVLRPVRGGSHTLAPAGPEGGFEEAALALAAAALAHPDDGAEHPIEPRLVELVYDAVRHFRAPWVHVISGYRPGSATSRHAHGRAIDFVLPGVSDRRLAAWARRQGFVGVGIYPVSGFVHLDVRERSYFWTDSSGPSEANRERPVLRREWARADRDARRRGVEPTSDDAIRAARASGGSGDAAGGDEAAAEPGEGALPPETSDEAGASEADEAGPTE